MPTWYEHSNADGFFKIEFSDFGRGEFTEEKGFKSGWALNRGESTLARGRDAEAALAAAVAQGIADHLRLPRRLIDWNHKRR